MKLTRDRINCRMAAFDRAVDDMAARPGTAMERSQYDMAARQIHRWAFRWYVNAAKALEDRGEEL